MKVLKPTHPDCVRLSQDLDCLALCVLITTVTIISI